MFAFFFHDRGELRAKRISLCFRPNDGEERVGLRQTLEHAVNRRSVLLALLFSHLSYYHPKAVTFEDCATGVSNRIGISASQLEWIRDEIMRHPIRSGR